MFFLTPERNMFAGIFVKSERLFFWLCCQSMLFSMSSELRFIKWVRFYELNCIVKWVILGCFNQCFFLNFTTFPLSPPPPPPPPPLYYHNKKVSYGPVNNDAKWICCGTFINLAQVSAYLSRVSIWNFQMRVQNHFKHF